MTATTETVFRQELNKLHGLALEAGWMTFHLSDAAQVPHRTLLKWLGGYACPGTAQDRDQALTAICNALELRPI